MIFPSLCNEIHLRLAVDEMFLMPQHSLFMPGSAVLSISRPFVEGCQEHLLWGFQTALLKPKEIARAFSVAAKTE